MPKASEIKRGFVGSSQYTLTPDAIGDAAGYITDGLAGVYVLLIEGAPVAIQLPQSVELKVADPAWKSNDRAKR